MAAQNYRARPSPRQHLQYGGLGFLRFERLSGNATIARPSPAGSYDDLHQIEFTFLPLAKKVVALPRVVLQRDGQPPGEQGGFSPG